MLISTSRIEGSKISATDGTIGKVTTFVVDDEQWVLRYIVARGGPPLFGREVLLSPASVTGTVGEQEQIEVGLTRDQVKNAPPADLNRPMSRRQEEEFHRYYQLPVYWGAGGLWGPAMTPAEAGTVAYQPTEEYERTAPSMDETHLRSTSELEGYDVTAAGTNVGTVSDFLIEVSTWAVRYLRISTDDDSRGADLFISPHWTDEISWADRRIGLSVASERLYATPRVGTDGTLSREEEEELHRHFGKPGYWNMNRE